MPLRRSSEIFSASLPHPPLTYIKTDMSFGADGVNSLENLSSLLEEFTAGMAPANYSMMRKSGLNFELCIEFWTRRASPDFD